MIVGQLGIQEKTNSQFRLELGVVSGRLDEIEAKVKAAPQSHFDTFVAYPAAP